METSLRGPTGRIWPDDFWKKTSQGDRTKVQSTPLAAARGGEAWRQNVWRSVYIKLLLQLSLTLACIKTLSKTLPNIHGSSLVPAPCHGPYLHEQLPTALTELQYGPPEKIFFKTHPAKFFFRGPWGKSLHWGVHKVLFCLFVCLFLQSPKIFTSPPALLIFFFGFESTQLARQLQQERTQMEVR